MVDFGAQMWGYNGIFRKDAKGFLAKMSEYGYRIIEPDIRIDPNLPEQPMPIWDLEELDAFSAMVQAAGMRFDSAHVFGSIVDNIDRLKGWRECYGIRAVVHQGAAMGDAEESIRAYADLCRREADALAGVGLELWLHNGGGEVRPDAEGISPLEKVLRLCDGAVYSQLDVGWALYGGVDPVGYTLKVAPWLRSVHYKDMARGYQTLPFPKLHTGLGRGALDAAACWLAAKDMAVTHILDQDDSELDMMDDARTGLELMRSLEGAK